jgi:hypothetical protein
VTYVVSLGELEDYLGLDPSDDEVYVLRAVVRKVTFEKLSQPLEWVAALGRVFGSGKAWGLGVLPYDIRGVVFEELPGGGIQLDFIVTFSGSWSERTVFKKEWTIRDELAADAKLTSLWPELLVGDVAWFYLAGQSTRVEVSYWLVQPLLWDHRIGASGSTTQAWKDMQNVWIGTAEKRQRRWTPPVVPPITPPTEPPNEQPKGGIKSEHLLGIVAIAAVGYFVLREKKGVRA